VRELTSAKRIETLEPLAGHWSHWVAWLLRDTLSDALLTVCVCVCVCVRERERGRELLTVRTDPRTGAPRAEAFTVNVWAEP